MPLIAEDNIVLRIIAETQKASREIDQLDKRVEGLEGSTNQVNEQFAKLGKFARNAAIVAVIAKMTQGMARFASQSVKAYAEFEKTQKSFEVLVGNVEQANKLIQDLRKFAKETPFTTDEVTRSAKTLLGFGRAAQDVMKDIEKLGELSAATGANLTQVALVYGQVASLGKLQGQDALQFINAGIPVYDLLAQSMGKSVGELKKLQEQGKITFADLQKSIYDASEAGGKFEGAIKAQATTLAGLQNQIIGGIDDIKIAIGEKLAPAVRSAFGLIGAIIDKVGGAVEGIENSFVLKVAAGIDAMTAVLDSFSNYVGNWVKLNVAQFNQFATGVELLGAKVVDFLNPLPNAFQKIRIQDLQKELDEFAKDVEIRLARHQYLENTIAQTAYYAYSNSLAKLKAEFSQDGDGSGGTASSLVEEVVLGKDKKKTESDVVKGLEAIIRAALKAYGTVYSTLLERSVRGVERTAQQSKEAKILAVFLARDLAQVTAQELRNFHQYASDELGSDNFVTLILEGYLKDAEGKEIDQDLVARIGGKLTDSIAKWTKKQKTGDDKKGFLQNLFGMSDKEFEDLKYTSDIILQSAVELTNSLVNEEIRRTDLLIQASRDRLQQLQTTASQGNAEQLQLEEERQRKLIEQRESYLQRQRQLNAIEITANNAVIVSNMIKGLSDAFKAGNIFGGIAYSIAAAATIATTIASVNAALTSVPAYWKGTEFVTGEGGIDNVPAMLSRGERVVDRNTNSTLNRWGVKNDDLLPLVGSAIGKYGPVSLFQGENVSRKEFKELSGKLERVEKAIYGIQFNVNIDPDGIGVAAGNYRNRQSKRNKLLS